MDNDYHIQETWIYPQKEYIYSFLCSFMVLILEVKGLKAIQEFTVQLFGTPACNAEKCQISSMYLDSFSFVF